MLECPICNRSRDDRYENPQAGESCADPCHWPYLSSVEVAEASQVMDRITEIRLIGLAG